MTIGNGSLSPSQLCKYHYSGYCKSKSECPNQHLELTCLQGPSCKDNYCRKVKRHPNFCRHYLASGFCKLEKECSYTHKSFVTEISDLKLQLDDLKNWIQLNMKQNTSKPKSQVQGPEYPCPSCPKICKSPSGLKRHTQTRHLEVPKIEDPSPKSKEQVQKESNEQSQITVGPGPELDNSPSIPPEDSEFECSLDNPANWSKKRKKKELALIIEEKLKSHYLKQNAEDKEDYDENPHKKYIFDIRTRKKYIYDHQERGIFRFTSQGGLAFTIFYNQLDHDIPSAEMGDTTIDANNRIQFSNVEQIESLDEEDENDQQGPGNEDQGGEYQPHGGQGADYGHHEHQGHKGPDEPGSDDPYPGHQQADDIQDTSGQDQLVVTSQDCSQKDFDIQNQQHTHQEDSDPDQYHSDNSDIQDQDPTAHMGYRDQGQEDSDNSTHGQHSDQDISSQYTDNKDDKYSDDEILNEIENYFSTKR